MGAGQLFGICRKMANCKVIHVSRSNDGGQNDFSDSGTSTDLRTIE